MFGKKSKAREFEVILSEQDLGDFLDGNQNWMEQYRAELERRLRKIGRADVTISRNALNDRITVDGERDEDGVVTEVMNQMVNDWSWLKQ